jgi:hypothetical protein
MRTTSVSEMFREPRTTGEGRVRKIWTRRLSLVMAIGGASLALSGLPAAAATHSTPNGDVAACNMLVSFLPSGAGMGLAMSVNDAEHGDAGMFGAVDASTGAPACA